MPFEDNRHLTRLLGEYDANLALIEDRLGIEAHAHGNVVTLTGPEAATDIARTVLEQLYKRASIGERLLAEALPGDRIAILGARDDSLSEFATELVRRLA